MDFNFKITNSEGREIGNGKQTMILCLESGSLRDEKYLDKIELWLKSLKKDGTIECDLVDAREIKQMVLDSQAIYNVAKIPLKNYIQERIDTCTVDDKKTDSKKANHKI